MPPMTMPPTAPDAFVVLPERFAVVLEGAFAGLMGLGAA